MKSLIFAYGGGEETSRGGWLRGVDPRAKTIACLLALAGVGAGGGWAGSGWLLAVMAAFVSGLRFGYLLRGLTPVALLCLTGLILNGIAIGGKELHALLPLSAEGLVVGAKLSSQLFAAAALARILAYTTRPDEIAASLNWMLGPLGRVGIPVGDFFRTVSVALSLLPALKLEAASAAVIGPARGKWRISALSGRWSTHLAVMVHAADSVGVDVETTYGTDRFSPFTANEWLTLAAATAAISLSTVLA
jgi:energy-coupling factor transport system permease protein